MDKSQLDKLMQEANEGLVVLRSEIDSKFADSAESKEKISKIEAVLEKQEEENRKLVKEIESRKSAEEDAVKRFEALEAKTFHVGVNGASNDDMEAKASIEAFETFLCKGRDGMTPEQKKLVFENKYLRTDSLVDGGALAPPAYTNDLLKNITEVSPMRQFARIDTIQAASVIHYTRNTLVSAAWANEGLPATASNSKYGNVEIPTNSLRIQVDITQESEMLSMVDMAGQINSDAVEAFAQYEGAAFVTGNGIKRPEGFTTNGDVAVTTSAESAAFSGDDLITLAGTLKKGYNPVYTMNRTTAAFIRKLKGGDGHYLFAYGNLGAGLPNTINGYAYSDEFIDMADVASGAKAVAFGDFKRGYNIVDASGMIAQRNPFRTSGFISYEFARFVGGQVVRPEAIKILQCGA